MRIDRDLVNLVSNSAMKSGNNYGVGVILVHPTTRKILLAKRTDTKNMCTPGGKCEIGESPLMAALRETKEESNATIYSLKFYDYEMHTAENGKNWTSFMFITDDFDLSDIKHQATEVEPWNWYTVREALEMDLFPPTKKSIERAIELGVISIDCPESNYIPFVNCPTSGFNIIDTQCCAYSFVPNDCIFSGN